MTHAKKLLNVRKLFGQYLPLIDDSKVSSLKTSLNKLKDPTSIKDSTLFVNYDDIYGK